MSTFLKCVVFGGVLSDVNYSYLLLMLCEIIDRIGFEMGLNFLKNVFFKKVSFFWVWRLFIGD